ncbi:MAG: imidazole glycerol phosphate synthase subunit HisH, partial [Clostridia bacterium]|nr:imidazole glycerol phosphate synthase subunit HisH [Clostridia bacterium]
MLAIVDYGVGNLFSLKSSLKRLGIDALVTGDANELRRAERIILPGVGAFEDAANKLRLTGLDVLLKEEAAAGKPLMGICLGMQLLFEASYEYGEHAGLALLPGTVKPIAPMIGEGLKVPHIGWNGLIFPKGKEKSPLFREVDEGECVYFVHSYAAVDCEEAVTAKAEYGALLTAAAGKGNVMGTQFHPE